MVLPRRSDTVQTSADARAGCLIANVAARVFNIASSRSLDDFPGRRYWAAA